MDKRLAVVTGSNKGIGLEVCRQLARKGLRVVLTSRDEEQRPQGAGNCCRRKASTCCTMSST